jgi:hypothetical protein
MSTYLLFFVPLFLPVVLFFGAFLYILFTIKMITEVASNHDFAIWEKVLWSLAMVPLLPITAAAYFLDVKVWRHHHAGSHGLSAQA